MRIVVLIAIAAPLMAQSYLRPVEPAKPLGSVRFPAAQALETPKVEKPASSLADQVRRGLQKAEERINEKPKLLAPQPQCVHMRFVKPSPADDPKIVAGPPQSFQSNMPAISAMPACASN